jgi:hypothetical protein
MKNNFDRRFFLKASGISMALPFMPSLKGQSTPSTDTSPQRMVFIDSSLGMEAEAFFPKQTGSSCQLSKSLEPLESMRNKFTVFSNMEHLGITGGHRAQHALLSGVLLSDAAKFKEGNITVDMKAAESIGTKTRFPSLHFGLGAGNNRMSWTRNGNSVPMITRSQDIFKTLFMEDSPKEKARRKKFLFENSSVIDAILEQSQGIAKGLDKEDKDKLNEYMSSVRETEVQLQAQRNWINQAKPQVDQPKNMSVNIKQDPEAATQLYYDLMYLAIKTDSSRILNLQISGGSSFYLPEVKVGYHLLSHHGKDQERLKQLHIIEKFHMQQLGKFMKKLASTEEAGSTLLDKTAIFFGASMGNASSHSNRRLPALLAGGGFKHQTHMKMPKLTQLNNLYLTMLQNFGLSIDQFGPSTGTLDI